MALEENQHDKCQETPRIWQYYIHRENMRQRISSDGPRRRQEFRSIKQASYAICGWVCSAFSGGPWREFLNRRTICSYFRSITLIVMWKDCSGKTKGRRSLRGLWYQVSGWRHFRVVVNSLKGQTQEIFDNNMQVMFNVMLEADGEGRHPGICIQTRKTPVSGWYWNR